MTEKELTIPAWVGKTSAAWFLFVIWLMSVIVSLLIHREQIALLAFWDPDDSMRLIQVRDFLDGQSWFDVSQHRANPPVGGPMHWSRLVDLPIAAFILLLRQLVGPHSAEIGAVLLVPAVTLAALLGATYWAVRAQMDKSGALLCCVALVASPTVFVQFPVMRIDHHAWQIVMAALALGGIFHRNTIKGGAIAGLAMATWILISIEGLPFAALIGAVLAYRYASNRKEWPRLSSYIWTLTCISIALFFATHGWQESRTYCDAISPAYLVPLSIVPLIVTAGHRIVGERTLTRRMLPPLLAGCAAFAIFVDNGRECLAGPLSSLDPLIFDFWYKGVSEGLPIWMQSRTWIGFVVFASAFAVAGNALALSREGDHSRKIDWICLLILLSGATVLGVLVLRTFFVAHLFGLPGTIFLVRKLFKRSRRVNAVVFRVPATAISLLLLFPMVTAGAMAVSLGDSENKSSDRSKAAMPDKSEFAALGSVAPATIFAPIDFSPDILLRTRNSIIGTGHHRNVQGMSMVIKAFLAPPREARTIVLRSSASYLLIGLTGETERYGKWAPQGLAAQLLDNKPPGWLILVQVPGLKALRLYRIDRTRA